MLVMSHGSVIAQNTDPEALARRIEKLERSLTSLEQHAFRGGGAGGGTGTLSKDGTTYRQRTEIRIAGLETQLRDMTGQIERLLHEISGLSQRMDKLVADADYRLAALEQVTGPGGPSTGPKSDDTRKSMLVTPPPAKPTSDAKNPASAAIPQTLPAGTPIEQYNYAQQLVVRTRYTAAAAALQEFLQLYPDHKLVENAQYWLGETYYVRKLYQDAATQFLEGYQRAPEGNKAPDNLLKLGMSLAGLKKSKEACIALNKLLREFPQLSTHLRKRATTERRKLGCK
jgi:tol-pal system protein YbgF